MPQDASDQDQAFGTTWSRWQIMAGYLKSKSFSHEKAQIKDLWLKAAVINNEGCNWFTWRPVKINY